LRTITEDAQSNSGFVFVRAEGEELSTMEFSLHHLHGGWHLASRKSNLGHVYSLIVNAEEEDELNGVQAPSGAWETAPGAARLLNRLERAHVVPPSRHGLRLVRGLYQRTHDGGCTFAVSPFIVARIMDWRHQQRVLIASILTEQYFQHRPRVADILRYLLKQPRTEEQIWTFCRARWGGSRAEMRKTVEQLKEDGIIVICDLAARHDSAAAARDEGNFAPPLASVEPALSAAEGA
jgi:hypothetical protein